MNARSMRILLWVFACLVAFDAPAQERKYAIMSLIGDGLLIVHRDRATGSNLDRNIRNFAAFKHPALDNATLLAIDEAMRHSDREVKTILLGGRDPALLALQSRGLDERGDGLALLLPAIQPIAQKAGATHLVIVTKHRDEARIRTADGVIGAGRIEGLGFYLDRNVRMQNRDTGESTDGYIAPFGYFTLSLVELSGGKVLDQEIVREAFAISNQKAALPWDAITPEQKVQMLQDLIRGQVQRAIPLLLDKP
jgi:hypothetical protein